MTEHDRSSERDVERRNAEERIQGSQSGADAEQADQEQYATKRPRPDTIVRASQPDARVEMERGDNTFDEPSFSKGDNAPTANQTGLPYTVEERDEMLREAPAGRFPDTPGGTVGAAPLSAQRETFLGYMMELGHFESPEEAHAWARAIFDALRELAIDTDAMRATKFDDVVRVGEAPEVQVETMMWGADFLDRFAWLVSHLREISKHEFYAQVASYAHTASDDPWIDAAVYSFLGALKRMLGDEERKALGDLGELQEVWKRI